MEDSTTQKDRDQRYTQKNYNEYMTKKLAKSPLHLFQAAVERLKAEEITLIEQLKSKESIPFLQKAV